MEEAIIKSEETNKPRKSGGRPLHDGWTLYHFEKVEGEKGKSVAKCIKCLNLLKNTTISRLLAHRKKCGRVPETILNPSTVQNTYNSHQSNPTTTNPTIIIPHQQIGKIEIENFDEDHHQPQQHHEVLWTQAQNHDTFMDESINVNQSSMDIVNEDIRRHRKSQTQHVNQRRRSESTIIDSALSSFLIGCNLTFDVVDSKHFKNFVSVLNPDYKIPSSSQLTSKVLSQLKGGLDSSGGERSRSGKKRKYYSSDDDSDYE
ncbi:hypothetical protein PVAND_014411 [Polypedilum vanderplanki]|uniref:BED-type domain-containing protein n=1 Tax=Polypedilum vanderplanki TaxID=319348 RepID=A0A9J6B9T3_POLVA|nr:hypothetical protein PVAND_014411 [Polypedilum vanderplanki]